jgi:hypothetical protein
MRNAGDSSSIQRMLEVVLSPGPSDARFINESWRSDMNHPLVSPETNPPHEEVTTKTNRGKAGSSNAPEEFVIRLLDLPVETDADGFPITQALSTLEDATAPQAPSPFERSTGRRTGLL